MFTKILRAFIFLIVLTMSSQTYAQFQKNDMGVGASVGFSEKVQLHFVLSDQSQFSLELGDIVIDDDIQLGNLGVSFKHLIDPTKFTGYIGASASYLRTNDDYLHLMVLLGAQKFVSKDLALFAGLNPGLFLSFDGDVSFILSVEFGAAFYF